MHIIHKLLFSSNIISLPRIEIFKDLQWEFSSMQTCHTHAETLLCRQCCEGSLPKKEEGRKFNTKERFLKDEKKTVRIGRGQKEASVKQGRLGTWVFSVT